MKKLLLVVICGFCLAFVHQSNNVEFESQLQEFYKNVESLSANFKQEKHSMLLLEPLKSEGKFYFKKPDAIRWEETKPQPNYFAINGDIVVRFDGKSKTVSDNPDMQIKMFKRFILKTIDGSILNDKNFSKQFEDLGETKRFVLLPNQKQLKKRMAKIELLFNSKTYLLEELKMFESEEEFTVIQFNGQSANKELKPELFN
ncbi:MAG: outer membrane lipoprotein carrier protein LolA [Schleiferiaceae bacterium]|jgi:outer membrane lipoprotein-sorting protein|nr:outer membrane lipoprotein carrier protein LolA [Schleiferiaceae bacterium]